MSLNNQENARLEFIFNSYFNRLIVDSSKLLSDVVNRKGWFLYFIKDKIEVLKNINDADLEEIGEVIMNNLKDIKNYDFLVYLINSLYSTDTVNFENTLGGEISLIGVDVNVNYESVEKIYNGYSGDSKVYNSYNKDDKIYKRLAILNDTDLFEFLPQFLLKGVRIKEIEVVDNSGLSQVYLGGEALLLGGDTVFL